MNKLPKQILNYFATFTETRFNFRRLINYKWTNNELTLDFSFFPKFQEKLITSIREGKLDTITVAQNEYAITIPKEKIMHEIEQFIKKDMSSNLLEDYISQEKATLLYDKELTEEAKEKQLKLNTQEALRKYNLELRKQLEQALIRLQEKTIEELKDELSIEHVPPTIFGMSNYINQHLEKIKLIAKDFSDSANYVKSVLKHFENTVEDITIYDLFFNLQKYNDFAQLGTLFLFFHSLEKTPESFPLFFVEVEIKPTNGVITLSFPRELVLINTPAINYFKFDTVLTIPRAVSPKYAKSHIGAVESFFQNHYGFQTPFAFETSFNAISHSKDDYPSIKCRLGLQTVVNEDKKLLDYSELITKLELGGSSRFGEFINQYISGTVPNHQEEVDTTFRKEYPIKSPKRYISESPIPLNNSQKRILLALENTKNNLIVVDGPPGTGKSHTIAALTYWANENKKSVVVTSHKKEALDVIDRMLTEKFKSLHPQAKPSIVRMDSETGSANNLMNTLQTSVINAANERSIEFNETAFKEDQDVANNKLFETVEKRLEQNNAYKEYVSNLVKINSIEALLKQDEELSQIIDQTPQPSTPIDISLITNILSSEKANLLENISLEEYLFVSRNINRIPEFIDACEKLNQIPQEISNTNLPSDQLPEDFKELTKELSKVFKTDKPLQTLTLKDTNSTLISRLIGKTPKATDLENLLKKIKTLQNKSNLAVIADVVDKEPEEVTLEDIKAALEKIDFALSIKPYQTLISEYKSILGKENVSILQVFESMRKYNQYKDSFAADTANSLHVFFTTYGTTLQKSGVNSSNLGSLSKLIVENTQANSIWQWIQLHIKLSNKTSAISLDKDSIDNYFKLKQRQVEFINDTRLKDLNNHLGEIARIKVSYEGGKRFSKDEANVLLNSVSCIIAEPSTISKHFPMEEELIDILIIDEASQVSIADSISLLLRAKQVVIFGDEYQYGAVSAVNVNAKYSTSYFSEIVSAYSEDYHKIVSDEAKKELVEAVSQEVSPEDQVSDTLMKPQDGTVLWLKTFDIRTSTLTFAKAIANYTTSLKEHFRSFPEIIGYSNDFFYKQAQMELLVNRIRTKPIAEVLQFISVECQGRSSANVSLDEIEAIAEDIQKRIDNGFKGTVGIITSFKEQQARTEQYLNERFNMPALVRDHKLAIWFVGDVQGEERDIVYYSFVENKEHGVGNLASIYPVLDGSADNIRSLKMQRLNVGFSRAKDTMVFVHSQPIENFSNTRLGDALKYYKNTLETNLQNDFFIEDESIFDSPMEKKLYTLLTQTKFVQEHRDHIKIVPQFNIGKYVAQEFAVSIPKYRADFLLTYSAGGKEKVLVLEYDGVEYHFKNPTDVDSYNFSKEYLDYDISRQLELESYGYKFLRINKFNLKPRTPEEAEVEVLNSLITERLK